MTVIVEGLGKITASKEVLNAISLAFTHEKKYYEASGRVWVASQSSVRADSIYDALSKVGYYDNAE